MRPQGDPSIGKPGRGRGLEDIWQICMRVNIYSKRGDISTSWSRSQDGWHHGTECVWHVGQCIVTGDFGPAAEHAFAEKTTATASAKTISNGIGIKAARHS